MTQISERILVQAHLAAKQVEELTPEQEAHYCERIIAELKAQDAVLVAHYYCAPIIQELAEKSGAVWLIRWKWRVLVVSTVRKRW